MMETSVNIIPHGNIEHTYNIGKLLLWNTLEQDEFGFTRYLGAFFKDDGLELDRFVETWHRREDGAWKLVELLIQSEDTVSLDEMPEHIAEWYLYKGEELPKTDSYYMGGCI